MSLIVQKYGGPPTLRALRQECADLGVEDLRQEERTGELSRPGLPATCH